jgi:hypothetical protein
LCYHIVNFYFTTSFYCYWQHVSYLCIAFCNQLTLACIMWVCCNLNRFVLYITMDKLYIPQSHVGPSVDWMNVNKKVKWSEVMLYCLAPCNVLWSQYLPYFFLNKTVLQICPWKVNSLLLLWPSIVMLCFRSLVYLFM